MTRLILTTCAVVTVMACGTTAPEPNPPGSLPHGGTGEFRPMTPIETGISGTPPGIALLSRNAAVESGAAIPDGPLFYAAGDELDMPPDEDPTLPEGTVDWAGYEPRTIRRAARREEEFGFIFPGVEVLAASEAWEMGEVYSPWPFVMPDGRVRLYYASPGGIGLAEASSVDGTFTRVGSAPIVPTAGADAPRRPSVVASPDGDSFFMYYEVGGRIVAASSADGVAFTTVADPVDLGDFEPRDADDPAEAAVGGPGALRVTTGVDRTLVRLYFDSRRIDGTSFLMMSGTTDGTTFERYAVPVISDPDRRDPSPITVDLRTTLIYTHAPRTVGGRQGRGVLGTIAPRTVVLIEEPELDAGM